MSRSRRKTPISSICSSAGQKKFKKYEHKAERKKVKMLLRIGEEELPHPKEYGNEWSSPRDGKSYFGNLKNQHTKRSVFFPDYEYDETRHQMYTKGMRK